MPFTYHSKQIVTTVQFYKFSELIAGCPKEVRKQLELTKSEWFKRCIVPYANWSVIQDLGDFYNFALSFNSGKKHDNAIIAWHEMICKECDIYIPRGFGDLENSFLATAGRNVDFSL